MSDSVKIISPVDGSVYAERPIAKDAAVEAALTAARGAPWRGDACRRTRPLHARLSRRASFDE